VKNNLLVSWAMAFSLVGMKCAILLNRSITMIVSNPLDGGKLTMKSMDTLSHGPSEIGNGRNNPAYFLLSVRFCWQIKTSLHIFLYIVFKLRPIIGLFEECYGAFCTTMAHKWPIMALLQEHIPSET
jgi:hypothetical protein